MKITGLDGKEYSWSPAANQAAKSGCSSYHAKARELLKELYPFDRILEEVTLPGSNTKLRKSVLFVDFYIPNRSLLVEIQGEQHFEKNSFFHKDSMAFYKGQSRDRDKIEWASINGLTLISLNYDETEEQWRMKLA